jgi:hypothetical protein
VCGNRYQGNDAVRLAANPTLAAAVSVFAAILFHSIKPSGAFEKRSMHGACPVIKGKIYHHTILGLLEH